MVLKDTRVTWIADCFSACTVSTCNHVLWYLIVHVSMQGQSSSRSSKAPAQPFSTAAAAASRPSMRASLDSGLRSFPLTDDPESVSAPGVCMITLTCHLMQPQAFPEMSELISLGTGLGHALISPGSGMPTLESSRHAIQISCSRQRSVSSNQECVTN